VGSAQHHPSSNPVALPSAGRSNRVEWVKAFSVDRKCGRRGARILRLRSHRSTQFIRAFCIRHVNPGEVFRAGVLLASGLFSEGSHSRTGECGPPFSQCCYYHGNTTRERFRLPCRSQVDRLASPLAFPTQHTKPLKCPTPGTIQILTNTPRILTARSS
jgi:hypothetical protein